MKPAANSPAGQIEKLIEQTPFDPRQPDDAPDYQPAPEQAATPHTPTPWIYEMREVDRCDGQACEGDWEANIYTEGLPHIYPQPHLARVTFPLHPCAAPDETADHKKVVEANAAHIVRCVNAHAGLVAALTQANREVEHGDKLLKEMTSAHDAALVSCDKFTAELAAANAEKAQLRAAVEFALRDVESSIYLLPVKMVESSHHNMLLTQADKYRAALAASGGAAKE